MIPYTLLRVDGLTCCTQTIQGKKTHCHSLSENLRNAPKLQCTKILVTTPRHLSFKIHQKIVTYRTVLQLRLDAFTGSGFEVDGDLACLLAMAEKDDLHSQVIAVTSREWRR